MKDRENILLLTWDVESADKILWVIKCKIVTWRCWDESCCCHTTGVQHNCQFADCLSNNILDDASLTSRNNIIRDNIKWRENLLSSLLCWRQCVFYWTIECKKSNYMMIRRLWVGGVVPSVSVRAEHVWENVLLSIWSDHQVYMWQQRQTSSVSPGE